MIFWMSITAIGSMPENGSSSSMKRGSSTSARVISTRRRSPPESVAPLLLAPCPQVELAEQRRARALALACGAARQRLQDRQDVLRHGQLAEDRGLLRQVGDPEPRPLVHRQIGDLLLRRGTPDPAVGRTRPTIMLNVVVLPAPFGPSSPTTSPGPTRQPHVADRLLGAKALAQVPRVQGRRDHPPSALGAAVAGAAPGTGPIGIDSPGFSRTRTWTLPTAFTVPLQRSK